jgi:hypothetical protein
MGRNRWRIPFDRFWSYELDRGFSTRQALEIGPYGAFFCYGNGAGFAAILRRHGPPIYLVHVAPPPQILPRMGKAAGVADRQSESVGP